MTAFVTLEGEPVHVQGIQVAAVTEVPGVVGVFLSTPSQRIGVAGTVPGTIAAFVGVPFVAFQSPEGAPVGLNAIQTTSVEGVPPELIPAGVGACCYVQHPLGRDIVQGTVAAVSAALGI